MPRAYSLAKIGRIVYYKSMSGEFSIIIFDKSDMSSELTEIYLKELNEVGEIKVFSDYIKGCEECNSCPPNIAIIDVSDNSEFAFEIIQKLSQASIPVIATSVNASSATLIKAFRNGAREFLPKPVLKQDLHNAIKQIFEPTIMPETDECKIISVFSGKGGCGKTTIATNLALELAKQTGKKTALIDLNFCLGEVAQFLNIKNSFNLSNLLMNVEKTTSETIGNAFQTPSEANFFVLSESTVGESLSTATFSKISKLFEILKETCSYIIVDTPSTAEEKIFKTLQASDYVLYITAVNINSIKNSKRCIKLLKDRSIDTKKIKVILNRYVGNDELSIEEIEKELGINVYKKIPNNYYTVMSAINKGISVSEENINSNVAESFRELAVMLSDSIMNNSLKVIRGEYEH